MGCDWEVDSDAKEDRCGICHGDGSQCETHRGLYSKRDGSGDYTSGLCAINFHELYTRKISQWLNLVKFFRLSAILDG